MAASRRTEVFEDRHAALRGDDAAVERDATASAPEPPEPERLSKTRRKQASHELQGLGEALVELPDERLAAIPMQESLLDALREYKRTRSHEGRRRQMQYIGKLIRGADDAPLRAAVNERMIGRARDALALHRIERWRAELIDSDDALTRFATEHPGVDVQRLRAAIRQARADASLVPEKRSGRFYRELFQLIKEHTRP